MCVNSRPRSKLSVYFVQEMFLADGRTIVVYTAEEIHVLVDKFESAARNVSLTMIINKDECLYQPSKLVIPLPVPSNIRMNNKNFF